MIGGKVIGLIRRSDGRVTLHVRDERNTDQSCVDCREDRCDGGGRVRITIGDSVWWQAGKVMWTPRRSPRERCGIDFDIALPKLGYSYAFSHALIGE